MKINRQRYQTGSVRKVPRSQGFAWEFRFYHTDETGRRRMKVQTFDSTIYKTERDVRKAVEGQLAALNNNTLAGRAEMTFGKLIDRYLKEKLPELKHSTQMTNASLIELHIRPKWQDYRLQAIEAYDVERWIMSLPFGPASKVRARNTISRLLDLAMLWQYIPVGRNPMELVKIKGGSKRLKRITILTPSQFKALVKALPEPYNLMVLVCGCLGLRVSEALALKWTDFNFDAGTLTIRRVFTHGQIQESPKSEASEGELPVYPALVTAIQEWQSRPRPTEFAYVFANPKTGSPYSDSTILTRYLKPTAASLGIDGIGWHSIRHSYKTWLASAKINPAIMKDLMRHSDVSTTMNVYGETMIPELREGNNLVVGLLF
jgi:integrase